MYDRLRDEQRDTYEHLCAALREVFSPATAERRRLASRQFKDRSWKTEEPLKVYAGELERLIDKGIPRFGGSN